MYIFKTKFPMMRVPVGWWAPPSTCPPALPQPCGARPAGSPPPPSAGRSAAHRSPDLANSPGVGLLPPSALPGSSPGSCGGL